ncbi:phosphodiester glycosidase family protein [soil metagenome]
MELAARPQPAQRPPCTQETFEGSAFTVCRFDSTREALRLIDTGQKGAPLRGFPALAAFLGKDRARVRFAVNAGMYDKTGAPIGLFIEDGKQAHPVNTASGDGNFTLKPNGVFSLGSDGLARVETTEAYIARKASPRLATQSGPMLVIDGALHPAIQADGPSRNLRNGVGVSGPKSAVFVISENPVSFGKLARLFRDRLSCPNALYLDGAVSSLWLPSAGRMDSAYPLGPMLMVSAPP